MARKELRHSRHTVSLLTDHTAIAPKCRGKIPVEKMIALAVGGIIRMTCKEMKMGILIFIELHQNVKTIVNNYI